MIMTRNMPDTFNPTLWMIQGHIWVTPVWNNTENRNTPRPIVIVGNEQANNTLALIVNFITKQEPRDQFDIPLDYWQEAGLTVASFVRTAKPFTLLRKDLRQQPTDRNGLSVPRGYVGELHPHDLNKVITACKHIY
jgi:mRNA interferase MazF